MLFNNYGEKGTEFVKGKGNKLWDKDGKEYLDFTSGIGVTNLGHCYEPAVEALTMQANTLWHTSNLFKSTLQENVAELLVKNSCGDYVFFCNSGAEANEAAIKITRKYTQRETFITFTNSFHGRTFATMSATGQDKIKAGFGHMLPTFKHLPYNDLLTLEEEMNETVAGVIVEIIQGEGGVNIGQCAFLEGIQSLCKKYGALFIVDEVQTGIGRTAKAFAYQHFHLEPDIITLAKGLGNGIPIGAMIGKEFLYDTFSPGSHGSTFGGNYLALASAKIVVEKVFQDNNLHELKEKSERFMYSLKAELAEIPFVSNIRGKGLMMGVQLTIPVTSVVKKAEKQGLLVLPAGPNTIRLLPSFVTTDEEWKKGVKMLKGCLLEINEVTLVK